MILEAFLVLSVIILAVVLYIIRNYGTLEKCGIPVIPNFLCFGGGPWLRHQFNGLELNMERHHKYGSIFGCYRMSAPFIYVADPELIKQITVKDFDNFPGRFGNPKDPKYRTILQSEGMEWRDLRKAMTPTFTSGANFHCSN